MQHAIEILKEALSDATRAAEGSQVSECAVEQSRSLTEAISHLTWIREGWHKQPETFVGKIAAAINHHSLEAGSDTPDFILAEYLKRCLENFDLTMQHRATWFEPQDGAEDVVPPVDAPENTVPEKYREYAVKYRMLEEGEVIQEGDEVQSADEMSWLLFLPQAFGEVCHVFPARRPITTPEPVKQEYRMLAVGEVIQEGDEIHPATATPAFARDDAWQILKGGTIFIGSRVGQNSAGIILVEGGFRRPIPTQEPAKQETSVVLPPIKNPSGPAGWNHTGVGYVPKQEYRMLEAHEVIQRGDEFLGDSGNWSKTWNPGIDVGVDYVGKYRRPL